MNDNDITIVINGDELKKFVSFSISDSIDALASAFNFAIARDQFDLQININDDVEIFVNTFLTLTGRVNKISNSYDAGSHNINISGFSNTYDLTKATIFTNPNYATPIFFIDLAEKVLEDNGIQGIQISPTQAGFEQVIVNDDDENRTAGDIGESIFSFLDRYAKKVGVILTDDFTGKLVIYKNKPESSNIRIRNKSGQESNQLILSANYDIDYSRRYKKVIVRSQDENEDLIEASAVDNAVQAQGVLTIISENIVDIAGCQVQANWEVNKRRADSIKYDCSVFGFAFKGDVWKKNVLVDVDDDFAGIKSRMMIRSLRFSFSDDGGSTTDLNLTTPDAFGQKLSAVDRYNAIFGDTEDLRRYEDIFGDSP